MKKSGVKVKSIGMKVSVIISILLLVILGSKTIYDSISTYSLAVKNSENFEREETEFLQEMLKGNLRRPMKQELRL